MAVRIGADAVRRLSTAGDAFALQVRDPSDVGAALKAMKLARVDILGLASRVRSDTAGRSGREARTPTVSSVVNAPSGPMFLVENVALDEELKGSVIDVVQRRLEKAGIESATIEVPSRGGSLDALDRTAHAVVLRLFPEPRGAATALPADWLDIACEWVTGDLIDDEPARVRVLGVEFGVPANQVSAVVHECGLAKAWCDAVNGELTDRIRIASVTFGRLPHLALAAGGPGVDIGGLVARFRLLQEVARELAADIAYGCIDFEPSFEGLALGLSPTGWQLEGGAPPNVVARELVDEYVPDAYPYQVLGPRHVRRLGDFGRPYESLGDGHIEVTLDEPRSWMPTSLARDDVQVSGWDVLAPCLLTEEELPAALAARQHANPSADEPLAADLDGPDAVPDLDGVTLERSPHSRRGTKLTLLELVSWLNHEAHSDAPASVSPVLATFARWLAAGFDDVDRQALKAVAPRLIGTGPATPEEERTRQWLATEWLVRVQAPAWLRAAGMLEAAQRLEQLGPLTDDLELVRAVDILGTAITIASRRIDITASIVTEDGDGEMPDEAIVWAAWERVTETTGYVAASEAATAGAPAELTYATDLRVIECSRDPRVREELENNRQSVGDTAWTTALHAVAAEAWDRGWRAADLAARELSGFTVRVEMGRVAKTALARDTEDEERALEVADRAARDSLTRAVLSGSRPGDDHPWDAARNAARRSEGGNQWSVVSDESRRAIGEKAWAQAMTDARHVVSEVLKDANDYVARVVVAAVAREASSAAARGVALRAASVARAQGSGDDEAEAAAHEALQRIAIGLQAQAVALLDRLIDVEVPAVTSAAR